jgi:hypothetical protein
MTTGLAKRNFTVRGYHSTEFHLAVEDAWRPIVNPYPVGKAVTVYYDPSNPTIVVLEPGLLGEMDSLFKLTISLIVLCSVAFLFELWRGAK